MADYKSFIQQVKQANDIVDVVGSYIELRPRGTNHKTVSNEEWTKARGGWTNQPERKKGKWILTEDDDYEYCTCSECGYQNGENWMIGSDIPFCEMCGADMRGREDE